VDKDYALEGSFLLKMPFQDSPENSDMLISANQFEIRILYLANGILNLYHYTIRLIMMNRGRCQRKVFSLI
jgi:hypothetical protein